MTKGTYHLLLTGDVGLEIYHRGRGKTGRRLGKGQGGGETEGTQDSPVSADAPPDHPAAAGEEKWFPHSGSSGSGSSLPVPSTTTFSSHDTSK